MCLGYLLQVKGSAKLQHTSWTNMSKTTTRYYCYSLYPGLLSCIYGPYVLFYRRVIQETSHPPSEFTPLDYSLDHSHHFPRQEESSENGIEIVDYMLSNPPPPHIPFDKMSFADVMQFADFGPKLSLNQSRMSGAEDDNYFLRFQLLGDRSQEEPLMAPPPPPPPLPPLPPLLSSVGEMRRLLEEQEHGGHKDVDGEEEEARFSEDASSVKFLGGAQKAGAVDAKNRRKRPRSMKTSEEVESQRMTHIAVERNRRRQMNDHLRVLRSLMPGSYVQRGDQASIIGGAIEFVRELEQLLQCLESQKRRRLFGGPDTPRAMTTEAPPLPIQQPFFPPLPYASSDQMKLLELDTSGLQEETAENKSSLADIEVRLLGFDAMIKILSRRRPGQLLKIIAAVEDLQFNILHSNITTIEQTVLYSFNVKINGETRYTADDIANSVQQILSFIDARSL